MKCNSERYSRLDILYILRIITHKLHKFLVLSIDILFGLVIERLKRIRNSIIFFFVMALIGGNTFTG